MRSAPEIGAGRYNVIAMAFRVFLSYSLEAAEMALAWRLQTLAAAHGIEMYVPRLARRRPAGESGNRQQRTRGRARSAARYRASERRRRAGRRRASRDFPGGNGARRDVHRLGRGAGEGGGAGGV